MIRSLMLGTLIAAMQFCETADASTISMQSPHDYQVFQRDARGMGTVHAVGMCTPGATYADFRIDGENWQPLMTAKSGAIDQTIPLPAGDHWHAIEFRAGGNSAIVKIEHVGVGEVFIVAGQSNSTNYGSEKQKSASGMVSTFDGSTWRLADDPQPGTQDHSTGGSFIPAFGDALAAKLHVPIGIASVGAGGTSVREWLPRGSRMTKQPTTGNHVTSVGDHVWESNGKLYDGLIERLKQVGPNGCRAILWHQGESDAGQAREGYPADRQITGAEYHDWMKQLIAQSKKDAGWDVPWVTAQATYHSEKDPADEEFRTAQQSLWTEGISLQGPDTDQLRAEFRAGVHLNPKGLAQHGKMWAEWVEKDLFKKE